jgi:hypothetical protein
MGFARSRFSLKISIVLKTPYETHSLAYHIYSATTVWFLYRLYCRQDAQCRSSRHKRLTTIFDLQQLTTASVGGNTQTLIAIDDRSGYISVLGSKSKDKQDI